MEAQVPVFSELKPELIQAIKSAIAKTYGPRLDRIILFGSFARCQGTHYSDVDLLVVLTDPKIDLATEIARLNECLYPLSLASDRLIAAIPVSLHAFEEKGWHPLYRNVKREGLLL